MVYGKHVYQLHVILVAQKESLFELEQPRLLLNSDNVSGLGTCVLVLVGFPCILSQPLYSGVLPQGFTFPLEGKRPSCITDRKALTF